MTPIAATLGYITTAHSRVELALDRLRRSRVVRAGQSQKELDLRTVRQLLGSALYEAHTGNWLLARADLRAAHREAAKGRVRTVTQAVKRALERAEGLNV